MKRHSRSRAVRSLLAAGACAAMTFVGGPLHAQEPGTVVAADKRVQGRSYVFAETGETIPYALFVPSNYDASKKWPLIVGLHGAGRPYDWLMGYSGIIDFAQRDGFIMVTPLGYHPRGGFGVPRRAAPPANPVSSAAPATPAPGQEPLPANISELSEKDVMNVLGIARKEFNVDPDRIYMWGHSMGGGGTYHLAAKYPDLWAGLAVAAPAPPDLAALERFRHIPILVMHGDEDKTIPIARTREAVARMQQLGMQYVYVEVKGGDHSLFISKNRDMVSKLFSFFDVARKNERPQSP